MGEGGESQAALAVGLARQAYVRLKSARKAYEEAMLTAHQRGATFSDLARVLNLSEPAVRGFIRRAQRRQRGRDT